MIDWTFAPDWSDAVIERLEWMTDVIESRVGFEQRARLRAHPRRQLEYLVTAGGDAERVRLENLIVAGQGAGFMAPVWTDFGYLLEAAAAGASVVQVPTSARDFRPGERIALVGQDGRGEAATLAAVGSDVLTLAGPLARAWKLGTRVVPMRPAHLADSFAVRYWSDAVAATTVQFQFDREHDWPSTTESAEYRGYPVMVAPSNWDEDPSADQMRKLDVFDSETGLRDVQDVSGVSAVSRSHRWLLGSRAELSAFRGWLAARAGRLNPFWLPSLQADVELIAGPSASTVTLNVGNRGHALIPAGAGRTGRQDIMIETYAGARYYRRIVNAIAVDDASEQLVIDAPIGVALPLAEIRRVCFMRLARLDSDAVEIAHYTDELAVCQLSLASLRDA